MSYRRLLLAPRSFSIFFDSLMIKSGFKAGSVCEKNKQTNKNLVVGFSCFKKTKQKSPANAQAPVVLQVFLQAR